MKHNWCIWFELIQNGKKRLFISVTKAHLHILGERLEPVYAPIRHKLANALKNWHPSDPSAKMILQPWEKVFKPGHMEAFVSKNILPKLGWPSENLLLTLVINN